MDALLSGMETTVSPVSEPKPIPFKILLVVVYAGLFVYVLTQMILTLRGKNKKRSFNFGFLLICILWVGVRLVYFIHFITYDPYPSNYWDLFNTAAVDIQFAALTFLMLFYLRMMLRMRWQAWRRRLALLVSVINALFDAFSIAVFILQQLYTSVFPQAPAPSPMPDPRALGSEGSLEGEGGIASPAFDWVSGSAPAPAPEDDGFSNALEDVFVFFCGFMFFVLSLSMFVFGVRLCQLRDADLSMNAKEIASVTITLSVIFGSRSVFDFLNTFDAAPIYFPSCGSTEDFSWLVFLLFLWWEAVPIVLLLVTLAKSMYREQAVFGKRSTFEPKFGLFAEMDKEQQQVDKGLNINGVSQDGDEALLSGIDTSDLLTQSSPAATSNARSGLLGRQQADAQANAQRSKSASATTVTTGVPVRPGYGTVDDNYMTS